MSEADRKAAVQPQDRRLGRLRLLLLGGVGRAQPERWPSARGYGRGARRRGHGLPQAQQSGARPAGDSLDDLEAPFGGSAA